MAPPTFDAGGGGGGVRGGACSRRPDSGKRLPEIKCHFTVTSWGLRGGFSVSPL